MNTVLRLSVIAFSILFFLEIGGCTAPARQHFDGAWSTVPVVINYNLAPGASPKADVLALNQAGNQVFATALVSKRGVLGSWSSGGANAFPKWVRVTWREIISSEPYLITGGIVGNYTVNVQDRIPNNVFAYVSAERGRSLVLRFRLKDDAVLLAWDVQENSSRGYAYVYGMHGGDFQDPKFDNGKLIDPGWER